MEIIINKTDAPKTKYPCLKERYESSEYQIVLFSSERMGIVIYSEVSSQPKGHFRADWVMSSFSVFEGSVTLKND
jgi:hypothetical protein